MPERMGYGYRGREDTPSLGRAPETEHSRIPIPERLEARKLLRVVTDTTKLQDLLESVFSADSLLFNYALFASPRSEGLQGRFFNPTIDGADATTFSRFDFPSATTVKFPTYSFGVRTNTTAAKRILLREEASALFTLAHATNPTAMTGFGPLVAIIDYWLAPVRRDLFEARPSCWFGLCEERVTATATLPSAAAFGALVGVTVGPTGNWFAMHRSDAAGSFTQTDLGVVPVSEEFHRWTWRITNRLANGGAGVAELYYDTIKVFEVPTAELPAAAMFLAGAVGCPTDAGSNEKGFRLGLLQAYHTRSVGFRPWD